MRRGVLVTIVLAAVCAGGPVLAEQVIHFTNGTAMPIRSHTVQGNMIHVDLGGNAFIAFPFEVVEKVVEAGEEVRLDVSFSSGNKIIVDTTPDPGKVNPVRGRKPTGADDPAGLLDAKSRAAARQNSGLGDGKRLTTTAHGRKRELGGAMNPGSGRINERNIRGTTRHGNRNVIGSVAPPSGGRGTVERGPVMSLAPRQSGGAKPDDADQTGDSGADGGSDSNTDSGQASDSQGS